MSNVSWQKKPRKSWLRSIPFLWMLVLPTVLYYGGYFMNAIVMAFNNGQMPVLVPGGCHSGLVFVTGVHKCMTETTRLNFLADWIVTNNGIASPGDFLLWVGDWLMMPMIFAWVALLIQGNRWSR